MSKPLFTTKHIKAITEILNSLYVSCDKENRLSFWEVAGKFREFIEKTNPRFDEAKFRKGITKQ